VVGGETLTEVGRRPRRYFRKYYFDKPTKDYGKVKSVRLQPTEEKLLTECFYMLGVEGKSFNQKMQNFIPAAHKAIKRFVYLEEENKQLKEKVEKLENERLKERVKEVEEKELREKEETPPKPKPNDSKITEKKKGPSSLENWLH
jgi:hypothetical protein